MTWIFLFFFRMSYNVTHAECAGAVFQSVIKSAIVASNSLKCKFSKNIIINVIASNTSKIAQWNGKKMVLLAYVHLLLEKFYLTSFLCNKCAANLLKATVDAIERSKGLLSYFITNVDEEVSLIDLFLIIRSSGLLSFSPLRFTFVVVYSQCSNDLDLYQTNRILHLLKYFPI